MRPRRHRKSLGLTVVLAVVLAACTDPLTSGEGAAPGEGLVGDEACSRGSALHADQESIERPPGEDDPQFPWEQADPVVAEGFDMDRMISGGPPPDGIPPIEEPCFEPVSGDGVGDWLSDDSSVMSIEVNGDARAYPLAIMTFHEIVNDVIGGEPVIVTYCPLCNSGLAFHREVDGQVLDFGTSGRLFQSNLVMYDRQTRNLWVQFTGEAVAGEPFAGQTLERIPTGLVSWREFREAFPDGWLLTQETGTSRDYGSNPYVGYEETGSGFLFEGETDDRLEAETRLVGLVGPDDQDPVAIPLEALAEERVATVEIAGDEVVVLWSPGQASALDTADIDEGRDVGQTGAFLPVADGQALTFAPDPDDERRFVDDQTGSTWNVLGQAIDGPLEGERLEEVSRDDTWWFVWFAFQPDTEIHQP